MRLIASFTPTAGRPVDFEEVENYVEEVCSRNHVVKIFADPYQLFSTIQKMQKEGYPIEEFAQSLPNLTKMAGTVFDAFNDRTIVSYPSEELKQHALNVVAADSPRGFVIKKGMAMTAATEYGNAQFDAAGFLAMNASAPTRTFSTNQPFDEQPSEGSVVNAAWDSGYFGSRGRRF